MVLKSEEDYFKLLNIGVRNFCEFIDLEACWSVNGRSKFMENTGISKVISSAHDFVGKVTEASLKKMFQQVLFDDRIAVAKVIGFAHDFQDNFVLQNVVSKMNLKVPLIAMCAGERGKLSRVLNRFMTPVTHPALPSSAAPGQLSVTEILSLRDSTGMLAHPLNFYLFGTPISKSRSPLMHNTGFQFHKLPYVYELFDTPNVEEVAKCLRLPRTLGGSVTIPHKQSVIPYLDDLSVDAKAIGAVNTIYKKNGRTFGHNTDWIAIYRLTKHGLKESGVHVDSSSTALIVGAGGTALAACYAMTKLGMNLVVYNRTAENAEKLVQKFGGKVCTDLSKLETAHVVVGTVPPTANFELPEHLVKQKPVTVELVYFPRKTPLIQQAEKVGCKVVEGIELLFEQGVAAFEFFTDGKKAPRKEIKEAFLKSNNGELVNGVVPPNFSEVELF